jgi:methylenetetrahydrofolate--tRNA-(uracil-5-)-methyltransferase
LLDNRLRLKLRPSLCFAGQITGVEGYVESAAIGLLAGRFSAADRAGIAIPPPPATTALGALLAHITGGASADTFQPMNINFGLFPDIASDVRGKDRGRAKKQSMSRRALDALEAWLGTTRAAAAE